MSIDTVLVKYTKMYEDLRGHMVSIQNGVIPHADSEGAPGTLEEATQAIMGMSYIVDMVLNDLLEMSIEDVYEDQV